MLRIELDDHQREVLGRIKNGSVLCGGTGAGKTRTSLAYFYVNQGGDIDNPDELLKKKIKDLYIITTAAVRDKGGWDKELLMFGMSKDPKLNLQANSVHIDSWNNVAKYAKVENAFFIFDEQRTVGGGVWAKSFIEIARHNLWILLSATPGDTWMDYVSIFIANGFYKNKSEFTREHVVWKRVHNFYKVERYLGEAHLEKLRRSVVIKMNYKKKTLTHTEKIFCDYDKRLYRQIMTTRCHPVTGEPIPNASALCIELGKVSNIDISRGQSLLKILKDRPRAIVFYNYNYELDILRKLEYEDGTVVAEWNGQKHEQVPDSERWVFLVQYTAGSEGWNCITTDTMVFYSQTYSYKAMVQAFGRIDRMNTPYTDLYYYILTSHSPIDIGITRALGNKEEFNAGNFVGNFSLKSTKNSAHF